MQMGMWYLVEKSTLCSLQMSDTEYPGAILTSLLVNNSSVQTQSDRHSVNEWKTFQKACGIPERTSAGSYPIFGSGTLLYIFLNDSTELTEYLEFLYYSW